MSAAPPAVPVPSPASGGGRAWLAWPLMLLVLGALFLVGYLPRARHAAALDAAAATVAGAKPRVRVAQPHPAPGSSELRLPGTVEPARAATIFARSNGYVRRWHADLGERVSEGQLLAELDAPEMAHLLGEGEANAARARAALEQVKANLALAELQLQRVRTLGATVASQQEIDIRQAAEAAERANRAAAEAAVQAEDANVRRLQQLKSFSQVLAPFAGTITARGIDIGDLVTAGSSPGAKPLFQLAQLDQVRVVIAVPQSAAAGVARGLAARLVSAAGAAPVAGSVARTAGVLDPASRTLRAEVEAGNADGRLLPGMYVQVVLTVPDRAPLLMLNANALIVGVSGIQVATLGDDGRVKLKTIVIELDTGAEIGVASGLTASDRVVLNPPVGLEDGAELEVLPPPPAPAPAPAQPRP